MSLDEYIRAMGERRDAFATEYKRLQAERQEHEKAARELERLRERNGQELAGYLLPDLDDEDLAALERRLRYPVLLAEKRKVEKELAVLDAERRAIEADPRFAEREVRRIDLEQQLAEIEDAARELAAERAIWERSKHFQGLLGRGWFAPDYDGGMFDWLRNWRSCSLLMAELEAGFPGRSYPDDDDVRAGWQKLDETSRPVLELQARLRAEQAEIVDLEQRHQRLSAAPEERFQELYRALGRLIVDHLREAPESLLVELGKGDETVAVFLKKDVGLKKQASYLQELSVQRLDPMMRQIQAEAMKLQAKRDKLVYKRSRGKYVRVFDADVRALRTLPTAKWDARRAGFAKTRERVVTFDRWDRGSYVETFLWWDLVTHGARGDDLYEVRTFHERHPGWSVDQFRDPLDRDDVADANDLAAAASVDAMVHGDLAGIDPS